MKPGFLELLRNSLRSEEVPHPLDQRIAKRWVKERLKRLFPQFRNNPDELERAYQELGLEAHEGAGKGACTVYEITLPTGTREKDGVF